jgi:hypothetical protein
MKRRAPGYSHDESRNVFHLVHRVYELAVDAIRRHAADRREKTSRFAEFEDIDYGACMRELETIESGVAAREKQQILDWVIFWHYLK